MTSGVLPPECGGQGDQGGGSTLRRGQTRPRPARTAPCEGGLDVGKTRPHAAVVEAHGTPWRPHVIALAHTREGYDGWSTRLAEPTARALPVAVSVGWEATGPYWVKLYEALSTRG